MFAPDIDPIIFGNSLGIRWYSFMYVLGLMAVYFNFRRAISQKRIQATVEKIESVIVVGLLGVIVGARLFYVLFYNFYHFVDHPTEIFSVWNGGLSFHGAMVGVCVAVLIYCKNQNLSFWKIMDEVATVIPIGLFFGRIGNFINGELWGRPTDMPWGMIFKDAGNIPRHPSQLYEAFLEGIVLFGLMQLAKRKPQPSGSLCGIFLILYGCARFFIEFFRQPDAQIGYVLGPFTMGQMLSSLMWVIGTVTILYAYEIEKKTPHSAARSAI